MRKAIRFTAILVLAGFSCAWIALGRAPQPDPGQTPAHRPAMSRTGEARMFGTVTSVGVDRFEVKKMDGSTETVMVSAQTSYREAGKDIQLEDLKPGDHLSLAGESGTNGFTATHVNRLTEEQVQRMQQMQGHRAFGEITAIDGNTIKVQNRRGEQTVLINAETTFVKDGQTIALKDLKVGDRIMAIGEESNGQFAAKRVMTGTMQRGEGRGPRPHDNPNQ